VTGREKETFEEYTRRTSGERWAIRIPFALNLSKAYRALNYGPALKMLNWAYEKGRDVETNKKKRGSKRYVIKLVDFFFTYEEAAKRGLTHKQFSRAIRELHRYGFIEVVHQGSGLRENPNQYRLSERWRAYGTDTFEQIEFPENKEWKKRFSVEIEKDGEVRRFRDRNEKTGRWTRRDTEKTQRLKYAVDRRSISAVVSPDRRLKSAVENPKIDENTTAVFPSSLSTTSEFTVFDGHELKESKGQEVNRARGRGDGIPQIFAEALFHLPDDQRQIIIDLRRQVEEGGLHPLHARTKLLMPRIVTVDVARMLFPDPPKGGRP